ncbi:hypothetical protein N0V88_001066 [Collariella sp. IMI 366227]|nr:hypothetical protein N0V88_001066 [Collariella sp. IMI 366227]
MAYPNQGEACQLHQATDRSGLWVYESLEHEKLQPTRSMLCLTGIGSIPPQKRAEAEEVMKSARVPPEGGTLRIGEPFNCRTWLKLAVGALQKEGFLELPLHIGE